MNKERSREAVQYVESLKNGQFPKYHLTNHGENFTGDCEQLALDAFKGYQTSCGRHLLRIRLRKRGEYYVG